MNNSAINRALLEDCKGRIDQNGIMHHPFLLRVEAGMLKPEQIPLFITHWYKTAQAHREAFPGIIANIKDDEIRFELINILHEEYGSGDQSRIHVRILDRLLSASNLTLADVDSTKTLPATVEFNEVVSDLWSNGEHPVAYGLHFGLEYLASAQQQYFSRGMAKYGFLSLYDREYFDLHAEAEVRHVACSEPGFLLYAQDMKNHKKLLHGIQTAEHLLGKLWDEFDKLFFSEWQKKNVSSIKMEAEMLA